MDPINWPYYRTAWLMKAYKEAFVYCSRIKSKLKKNTHTHALHSKQLKAANSYSEREREREREKAPKTGRLPPILSKAWMPPELSPLSSSCRWGISPQLHRILPWHTFNITKYQSKLRSFTNKQTKTKER